MAKYKRSHYFIDKRLQTKYIVMTISLLFVYTFLFVCFLLGPYILALAFDNPPQEQAQAARMLLSLHKSIWPSLGALMLFMGFLTVFITHRIAGPVYRFKKVLGEVANGNLNIAFNLRKKDDLKDLAEDMESVIGELRTTVQTLQEGQLVMTTCISEIEELTLTDKIDGVVGNELIRTLAGCKEKTSLTLEKYNRHSEKIDPPLTH